jgi:uncharacterized secreted protein with C-terminal beta-propeller domain
MRTLALALVVAAAGLAVGGLAFPRAAAAEDALTSIVAITDSPDDFDGTRVTVAGVVAQQRIDFRGESVYSLDEAGRRITVVSFGPSPAIGAHLQVAGQVVVHPEGNSEIDWPPVLVESARSALP